MKKILFVMAFVSLAVSVSAQKSNPFMQEWNTPYGVPPFDQIKTYFGTSGGFSKMEADGFSFEEFVLSVRQ